MDRLRGRKPAPTNGAIAGSSTLVSKPFTAMTIEELFESLPKCNASAIMHTWIPAMRKKHDLFRAEIEQSAKRELVSDEALTNVAHVRTLSSDLHYCLHVSGYEAIR